MEPVKNRAWAFAMYREQYNILTIFVIINGCYEALVSSQSAQNAVLSTFIIVADKHWNTSWYIFLIEYWFVIIIWYQNYFVCTEYLSAILKSWD